MIIKPLFIIIGVAILGTLLSIIAQEIINHVDRYKV